MSEVKSRWLTDDMAVEQLLRDSVDVDLFGSPPTDLVQRALESFIKPCEERSSLKKAYRPTALIVLSLAAAGLFLTALPGTSRWGNRHAPAISPTLTTVEPGVNNRDNSREDGSADHNLASVEQGPTRSDMDQLTGAFSLAHVRTVRFRRHRSNLRSHIAPKAIWTTSIVSASEEGIILPVEATCSSIENPADEHSQSAVAVVPLQSSGLTYTEYTGTSGQ